MKTSKRKRKQLAALITAAAVLVLAGAAFILFQCFSSTENQFPMWEDAEEAEASPGAVLRLLEIDFAGPNISVAIENTTDGQLSYGAGYSVEYFHEGAWHIVYEPEWKVLICTVLESGGETEKNYSCPPKTFAKEGSYRLRVSDLGCCGFQVFFDETGAAGYQADESGGAIREPPICEGQYEDIPLGEILQKSKLILKGKYMGPQEAATHTDHVFTVLEVFRGSYDDSEISLCESPILPFIGCSYKRDVEYLLVLTKESNVYKEHDVYYYPSLDLHVPLYPGACMVVQGGRPLGETEEEREFMEDPIGFLAKLPPLTAEQEEEPLGTHYVLFDSWEEILPQCGYVLKLKIGSSVIKNEVWGTESFNCEVLEVYKGEDAAGVVITNFFDGMVEQGKEYIVLAERAGNEDSLVYPLAAKKDVVFPVGSPEAKKIVQAIKEGL